MKSQKSSLPKFLANDTSALILALTILVMGIVNLYLNFNTPPPNNNPLVEAVFYGSFVLFTLAAVYLPWSQNDLYSATNSKKSKFDERELSRRNVILNRSSFFSFIYLFAIVSFLIYSRPEFFSEIMATLIIILIGISLPSIVAVFDKRQKQ